MSRWKILPKIDDSISSELKSFPPLIRQLLFNRGITNLSEAQDYLRPTLKNFHDPFGIPEMQKAVDTILKAREQKHKIFIYGDYDVDGVVATSILWDFLFRKLGINVLPYIPSRFEEGYGLGKQGLDYILSEGGNLVISVDCGIRDIELVEEYSKKGLDFIITDHHTLRENENGQFFVSEDAKAVIHPKHPDSKYPFKEICGAAVSWKLISAISQNLKEELPNFDPEVYLDLVSLATITDIMPLKDENRLIVAKGLKQAQNTQNVGLRNLMLMADVDFNAIDTYHYGFVIGPRLNAAGRMEHALDAVRLLSTQNHSKASEYSQKLNILNTQRQDVTKEILEKAKQKIEDELLDNKLLFVWGEEWPEGIVGLVAGKLQENYSKPVLVASISGDTAVGSARSISNFNITEAISRSEKILERFGGHAQAAGFTVKREFLEQFKLEIESFANETINDEDLVRVITIDCEISLSDLNLNLIAQIEDMKPFGFMNKTPVFLLKNAIIKNTYCLGKNKDHVKLIVNDVSGGEIEIMGFRKYEECKHLNRGDSIDVVGYVEKNEWKGYTKLQMKLIEFKHND